MALTLGMEYEQLTAVHPRLLRQRLDVIFAQMACGF